MANGTEPPRLSGWIPDETMWWTVLLLQGIQVPMNARLARPMASKHYIRDRSLAA